MTSLATVTHAPAAHPFASGSTTLASLDAAQLASLERLARNLAGSPAEADDLLQDAIERALRTERFSEGSNLHAWMHTVMYRLTIDRSRRARRLRWDVDFDLLPAGEAEMDAEPAPWAGLDLGAVRGAATKLPAKLRRAFEMFTFEARSYADIASELEIPMRTVGTRISRARLKLRTLLQEGRVIAFPTTDPDRQPARASVRARMRREARA